MPQLEFTGHEATVHKAIVVSFDLGSFSEFCNQPEASIAAPRLIKRVFDFLNQHFYASESGGFFPASPKPGKLPTPSFIKFTGDGALMLWDRSTQEDFSQEFCNLTVETMRRFQHKLAIELPSCEKEWRVHKLPKRARMGISTGTVYALRPPHSFTSITKPSDFVGYCINLAVRLQDHCPELGFLVHGNLHPDLPGMVSYKAVNMKGSQSEPVAMFSEDAARISKSEFGAKFRPPDIG